MASPIVALYYCAIVSISQISNIETGKTERPSNKPDLRCGAYCLYVAIKAFDVPVASFEELEGRLGPASAIGYSFEQLRLGAETYSIKALPVITSLENLGRRKRPFACIARLNTGHFVLIGDVTSHSVIVVNPPLSDNEIPIPTFLSQWDRNALLVSPIPLATEESLAPTRSWWFLVFSLLGLLFASLSVVFLIRRSQARRRMAAATSN